MNFFMVDKDGQKSAQLLPDYAIKQVNVREGYHILSTIGHKYGVHWEGQFKPYNEWHPAVLRHCQNKATFQRFLHHYVWNCAEYFKRFGTRPSWANLFMTHIDTIRLIVEELPTERDEYQYTAQLLIEQKTEKIVALHTGDLDKAQAELKRLLFVCQNNEKEEI